MKITYNQICIISVLLAVGIFADTFGRNATDVSPSKKPQTPKEVFNDIRRAWQGADVQKLMDYLGDVKTIISFENEGLESGLYSRNQAYYLFENLFQNTKTNDFTFVKIIEVQERNTNPHAFANRTYMRLRDGSQLSDQIYIALTMVNNRWFITHIMSLEKSKKQHPSSGSNVGP
ncbi:MAG: DUF4783 domain-containing protein [Gemmatimonadota bacterium]|nr:MAG: DUF4783 domain-containing protein [Gemmatimonadota bacterium]